MAKRADEMTREELLEELRSLKTKIVLLQKQATTDPVTNLLNPRGFNRELKRAKAHSTRAGKQMCILFIDLDGFKQINDTHGHVSGDLYLAGFAEHITSLVREEDVVGRLGGDEFAVVLRDTDPLGAYALSERMKHSVARLVVKSLKGAEMRTTASFGLSQSIPKRSFQELLSDADRALYDAKRAGGNQVVAITPKVA